MKVTCSHVVGLFALSAACGQARINVDPSLPVYRVELPDLHVNGALVETSVAFAVNDRDEITGTLVTSNGRRAYHWRSGSTNHIDTLEDSIGYDINSRGLIVGSAGHETGRRAFVWLDGIPSDLPFLGEADTHAEAFGVNERGDAVGFSGPADAPIAVTWQFLRVRQLRCPHPEIPISQAFGITAEGVVAGGCATPTGFGPTMWLDENTVVELGRLPYAREEFGVGLQINNKHQVAGVAAAENGRHAFLWDSGTMIDLGDLPGGGELSIGYGLNNKGHVVGSSLVLDGDGTSFSATDPALLHHAFLWTPETGMVDLNSLIDPEDPLAERITLLESAVITDSGIVTGRASIDGKIRAYILRPQQ